MKNTPIDYNKVTTAIEELNLPDLGLATIREIVNLVNIIEAATGEKFIRMEMGVPGLKPPEVGINAEIAALKRGVSSDYPMLDGIKPLKEETSKFVKNFMNIDISAKGCVPTVGSMQGGYATFMLVSNLDPKKDTALFLDPGFSVQKTQFNVMGHKYTNFDVYNYRGEKLRAKLEAIVSKGNINSIIYSNPNNPSWICFNDEELKIIGDIANKYDLIVLEDLAYFAMDFRTDMSKPGEAPYQPSVANYTNNYILMISSSKAFSYAGARLGMLCISDTLYCREYPNLKKRFGVASIGYTLVQRLIYTLSSGVSHSAQYALAAMFEAANNGTFNFVEEVKGYGERAAIMKRIFTENGFKLVYDKDIDQELADGFYFTISYPGMQSGELINKLMYYGISGIGLITCGSDRTEGIRACVSQIKKEQYIDLENRVKAFNKDFPIK
ncbi:MAG: pyridoxal phosphate-dependent aminotransferase [Salinivirgaceae bacterium]|nr:pyridoxal phosphate-dependent aminotransferase [Salinivirgaceae bacterium]